MNENHEQEVYFWMYCPKCKWHDIHGNDEPCDECIAEFTNFESHRPVYFKSAREG